MQVPLLFFISAHTGRTWTAGAAALLPSAERFPMPGGRGHKERRGESQGQGWGAEEGKAAGAPSCS